MMEALKLIISKEGAPDRDVQIEHEGLIGRGDECLVQLDDRAVSRNHARIIPLEGEFKLEKKSKFGKIKVDGAEVNEAICKLGQLIEIGPYLIRVESASEEKEFLKEEPSFEQAEATPLNKVEDLPVAEMPFDVSGESNEGQDSDFGMELSSQDDNQSVESEGQSDAPVEVPFDINSDPVDPNGGAFDVPVIEDATSLLESNTQPDSISGDEDSTRVLDKSSAVEIRLTFFPDTDRAASYAIHAEKLVFGRSSSCEVPVEDKKASRKHAEIWKDGASYFVKDLESANGTYLNGARITESEIQSGDLIRIGDTDILFQVVQAGYEEQAQQFVEPISEDTQTYSNESSVENLAPVVQPDFPGSLNAGGTESWEPLGVQGSETQKIEVSEKGPKALIARFRKQWESIPRQRRYLFIFVMLFLLLTSDFEDPSQQEGAQDQKTVSDGTRTFEGLSAEQKRFVEGQHEIGFQHYKNKEYDKAIFELEKIFQYVDDYKDTKELVRYANEGQKRLKRIEEERKKKEETERIKKEIAELTEKAQRFMLDQKFDEAQALFPNILMLDPENTLVSQWQNQIEEWKENERIKEQERLIREKIKSEALSSIENAKSLYEKGEHLKAIRDLDRVLKLDISDAKIRRQVEDEIARHRSAIKNLFDPALEEANSLEDSRSYAEAYKAFEHAKEIDPADPRPAEGMARIRRILHDQAQLLYTEGVIAESLSDFEGARNRFEEIRRTIPKDDAYYDKASRRLERYDAILGRAPAGDDVEQ